MNVSEEYLQILRNKLNTNDSEQNWLCVLEAFLPVGVADTRQIEQHSGFSRQRVDRIVDKMEQAVAGGAAIIEQVEGPIPRPGVVGRGRNVYRLGEAGAALLRDAGHGGAHHCQLADPTQIAHALAVLDVRQAAEAAGRSVTTERELRYGENGRLRPDNLVALDGLSAIFEVEQRASPALLDRIVAGIRNKVAFFSSAAAKRVSPAVRTLFAVSPGREWERTIRIWQHAVASVARDGGGKLPFRLLAMPLADFIAEPDWSEPPDAERWEDLFDAERVRDLGRRSREIAPSAGATAPVEARPPDALVARSAHDDLLILTAIWQLFQEETAQGPDAAAQPDPAFFELVELIYAASHLSQASPLARSAVPAASLYLLQQYLAMHEDLRKALSRAISRGSSSMRWNSMTILHRMQVVINLFLKHHGWVISRHLRAYPTVAPWGSEGPQHLGVAVRIHPELLMPPDSGVVPDKEEVRAVERALAWVLWALFAYSEDIGLKHAVFW